MDDHYLRMIRLLTDVLTDTARVAGAIGGPDADRAIARLLQIEAELWDIFSHYAPANVVAMAAVWSADCKRCLLLGLFPLELPATAIANYRRIFRNDPGKISSERTRKKIEKLRGVIKNAWPTQSSSWGAAQRATADPDREGAAS